MSASYTATCYLVDVSPSMGEHIDPEDSTSPTKLQHALEFVRIKLAQRLINPKKTDQIAVVLFGGNTDNQLAEDKDGYEHIQELISMRQPSYADLRALDRIKLGKHSADMIAAMYVAGNLVRTAPVRRKDARKQVVLLTDAQEIPRKDGLPVTDWDDTDWLEPLLNAIIPGKFGMPIDYRDLFSLGVIGMDFGDPDIEEHCSSGWSDAKKRNVERLKGVAEHVNEQSAQFGGPRALVGNINAAIEGAGAPSIAPINTQHKSLELLIGDNDTARDESLCFRVEVQKATQKAAARSMSKMRKGLWGKTLDSAEAATKQKKRKRSGEDDEEAEEHADAAAYDQGAIVTEKLYFYQPDYSKEDGKKKKPRSGQADEDLDEDTKADRLRRSEASRKLENTDNLSRAYKYGADLIPISKDEEADFCQFPAGEPGLQVRGFTQASDYRPELILGDPRWIFGGPDNQSQILFSSLMWAMKEAKKHGLVRLLLPKESQPRLHLLVPLVGEDAVDQIRECGLLLGLPFKEEVANWAFPSLDRIQTVSGRAVKEHRLLPKEQLLNAMDDFVDSMMLPVYTDDGGGENPESTAASSQMPTGTPWFDPAESYNPAIHNMRNCVIQKILHPSANLSDGRMAVHPTIERYLYPPQEILEMAGSAAMALQKAANLSEIPPKPKATRGRSKKKPSQKPATNALDDILGEEADDDDEVEMASTQAGGSAMYSQSQGLYRPNPGVKQSQPTQNKSGNSPTKHALQQQYPSTHKQKMKKAKKKAGADDHDSATEESDVDDRTANSDNEADEDDIQVEQEPNGKHEDGPALSLLSEEDPLADFEKLLEQPGMITPAVKQLLDLITRTVKKASSDKDYERPFSWITRVREVAIEEDEADVYNQCLRDLKPILHDHERHGEHFLAKLRKNKLGLVTSAEGEGGLDGTVDTEEATQFWEI